MYVRVCVYIYIYHNNNNNNSSNSNSFRFTPTMFSRRRASGHNVNQGALNIKSPYKPPCTATVVSKCSHGFCYGFLNHSREIMHCTLVFKCTVGFHNFNLRIFNLRVSNPNKLTVDVFLTRCRISMCQGLGPKKHDEISEIDRTMSPGFLGYNLSQCHNY